MILNDDVLNYLVECCKQEYNENEVSVTLFRNILWLISKLCRHGGHNNMRI